MREWVAKRYWIIGASEGLGAALAQKMSKYGAHVILSARNQARLEEIAKDLPGPHDILPMDVSDDAAVVEAVEAVGQIDGVVYVAGLYWPMPAQEWQSDKVLAMLDVNLTGAFRVLGHLVPQFVARDQGHIVLMGSLAGCRGLPGSIGYSVSKAGMISLAESLHCDLRKTNVSVQVINPGYVRTRLTDKNEFKMPQIMEPEDAAQICMEHMLTDRFERSFPAPFAWLFRWGRFMPHWLYFRLFS